MKLPRFDQGKRRLMILLAFMVLLQTVAGLPGLAAAEAGEAAFDEAGSHQSSALILESIAAEIAETAVDDECREPCDRVQCDCAFCCQGNQSSFVHDFVLAGIPPTSCWSMTSAQPPPLRIHSRIHRPPIA